MLLWRANRSVEHDLRATEPLADAADDDSALAVLNDRRLSLPHEHIFHTLWRYVWPN